MNAHWQVHWAENWAIHRTQSYHQHGFSPLDTTAWIGEPYPLTIYVFWVEVFKPCVQVNWPLWHCFSPSIGVASSLWEPWRGHTLAQAQDKDISQINFIFAFQGVLNLQKPWYLWRNTHNAYTYICIYDFCHHFVNLNKFHVFIDTIDKAMYTNIEIKR